MPIHIREYKDGDSIKEITRLLNRGYAALAEKGLRYVASWITPEMMVERMDQGTCFLAIDDHVLVGTVTLYGPDEASECPLYREPSVFHFGKFAVEPGRQGEGIGKLLYDAVETKARELDGSVLACDTAEPATHLIAIYQGWGFEIVGRQDWSLTNYESVVMSKRL